MCNIDCEVHRPTVNLEIIRSGLHPESSIQVGADHRSKYVLPLKYLLRLRYVRRLLQSKVYPELHSHKWVLSFVILLLLCNF